MPGPGRRSVGRSAPELGPRGPCGAGDNVPSIDQPRLPPAPHDRSGARVDRSVVNVSWIERGGHASSIDQAPRASLYPTPHLGQKPPVPSPRSNASGQTPRSKASESPHPKLSVAWQAGPSRVAGWTSASSRQPGGMPRSNLVAGPNRRCLGRCHLVPTPHVRFASRRSAHWQPPGWIPRSKSHLVPRPTPSSSPEVTSRFIAFSDCQSSPISVCSVSPYLPVLARPAGGGWSDIISRAQISSCLPLLMQ